MLSKRIFLILALIFTTSQASIGLAAKGKQAKNTDILKKYEIKVEENWISINGERVFIKAVMYSPAYPQESGSKKDIKNKRLVNDFKMIKEAGFNTIKTYFPLSAEACDIARKAGLFVMQGVGITYKQDFVTQNYLDETFTKISQVIEETKEKDNVILYCFGFGPDAVNLTLAGKENAENFFKIIKEEVLKKYPDKRISLAYGLKTGFPYLDLSDIASVKLHPFSPLSVKHSLGFYGAADWLRKIKIKDKPLILEGLKFSLFPGRKALCGCCGFTEELQSKELVYFYSNAVDAGANGLCIADWRDLWWKKNDIEEDALTHDENDPSEWLGLTYYDVKKKKIFTRSAYDALTEFNKMLVISPRSFSAYSKDIIAEVFVEDEIDVVEYRISGKEEWTALKEVSPHWKNITINIKDLDSGKQTLEFRAWKRVKKSKKGKLKKTHRIVCEKIKVIYIEKDDSLKVPCKLVLDVKSEVASDIVKIDAVCFVKNLQGDPVMGKEIFYSITNSVSGSKLKGKKVTDKNGKIKIVFSSNEPGIYCVAAGTIKVGKEYPRIKTIDIKFLSLMLAKHEKTALKAPALKEKVKVQVKIKKTSPSEKLEKITIKGDWIYVNGERFFVKGIGYSPAYPKEIPWKRVFNEKRMRTDLKLIKEAGFNTLRSWIPLLPEEVDLAKEFGIYVLQGVWVNYTGNFVSEENMMKVINSFYQEIERTGDKDNVLFYLLGNEPLPSQLFAVGLDKSDEFFLNLKNAVKKQLPDTRVSIANWVQSDFMDTRIWDVICVNLYPYHPESVSHCMKYYGYTEWIKKKQATDKPLILTELGLSVSLGRRGAKGYGGNTITEQKDKLISCYTNAVDAGATGVCIFEWIDEWWKNFDYGEDQYSHEENDPEEWFGIVYYDLDKGKLVKRPAYDAISKFNRALILSPKGYSKHTGDIPVEVYVNEDVDIVEYRIDEGDWQKLKRDSVHWMKSVIKVEGLKNGEHNLAVKAWKRLKDGEDKPLNITHEIVCEKKKSFYIDKDSSLTLPYVLTLESEKDICYTKGAMTTVKVKCKLKDALGKPVAGKEIKYSIAEPLANQALRSKKITDDKGEVQIIYFANEPGIISYAAGIEKIDEKNPDIKTGDIKHIYIYYNKMTKFRRLQLKKNVVGSRPKKEEMKKEEPKEEEKKSKEEKIEDK
ncbi:MAG: hypothetical protein KAI43_10935 [Candidatus Aureabacteria bacterium]|nr:hypothetical protein [Candidatus Auribacterota bacterium]